jgi:hypothetical protein
VIVTPGHACDKVNCFLALVRFYELLPNADGLGVGWAKERAKRERERDLRGKL